MRLLAVVVLYHPGKDLAGNIDSYLSQVDKLLLWDNTPGDGQERLPLPDISHPERLEHRGCGRNVGIGAALNDAVAYAREYGYTHLLTLDQDSFFLQGDFRRYITAIQEYGENKRYIQFAQKNHSPTIFHGKTFHNVSFGSIIHSAVSPDTVNISNH